MDNVWVAPNCLYGCDDRTLVSFEGQSVASRHVAWQAPGRVPDDSFAVPATRFSTCSPATTATTIDALLAIDYILLSDVHHHHLRLLPP